MELSPSQVIVLATPVFFALIGLEYAWGRYKGRNTYRLNDTINSITLGMLSEVSVVLLPLLKIGIYTAVFTNVALWRSDAFWTSWYGWLLALVFYDFCYYWLHRAGHEVALFWAAHVVHHQSQEYNLSTALRQTSSGAMFGWIFYLPMALAGVPPLVFGVVALIDLLYQFWVHTEHVPRLGWFDRWFCSPSNHRVHHAVNDCYVDRNYGGILVVWDRLFGTFKEEGDRCVYGTRAPLDSWDPLWSNAEVYAALARDSWHAASWGDKLRVWIKPPGWRPADVAARFPKPAFDIEKLQRYHPPMTPALAGFAAAQFAVLLGGVALFLWHADAMPAGQALVWVAALAASLWSVGAAMQGRVSPIEVLLIEVCALSTASAATSLTALHLWMKPAAMLLAMGYVAMRARDQGGMIAQAGVRMRSPPAYGSAQEPRPSMGIRRLPVSEANPSMRSVRRFDVLLLLALTFSLAGDVFLMLPNRFIPGLVSFLIAHLFYIALFKDGCGWLPSRRALAIVLALGAGMYAFLYGYLPGALKAPVAAYTLVICLMASQAIGRATVVRDKAAIGVAVGAGVFMVSDTLLAINRFAIPLPMAQFAVLSTYYVAQVMIAHNAKPAGCDVTEARSADHTPAQAQS